MTIRVPCKDCGAEILPATAAATGGICMACKQGIRKNIEASKLYYQKLKEYDPHRALWESLVKRYHKDDAGRAALTEDERLYFAAGILDGEVYNGGMDQFFTNSSGALYEDAVNALLELGALKSLKLLTRAAEILFDGNPPPEDRLDRYMRMRRLPDDPTAPAPEWAEELERIDRAYWGNPDGLNERLMRFAEECGLLAPFLVDPG